MQTQNLHSLQQPFPTLPCPLRQDLPRSTAQTYFILYGDKLNFAALMSFQQKCGVNFMLFDYWNEQQNTVVLLQGQWDAQWQSYAHQLGVDIAHLNFHARLQQKGLLVMDMDSTTIQIECIDEIAKLAGTGEMVSQITEQAMRGELDFEQSLRHRVATLKGVKEQILQQVRENLPLTSGLKETLKTLQKYGWRTAIASGGFTYFADYLKDELALDAAVSNQFEIANGILTGEVKGAVVDAQYKARTLEQLASQYHIPMENTVAIGDGANDLPMMKVANLGVAFHAKPKVQQQAQIVINFADLTALLCILGANDRIMKNEE
ncbi:phosphoserine phosphatase [Avibacterium paragallinarum]|uniref:phosphoserine phosphatase n=1 Tax=Avibacterium paragallinarum TaxID=728 RepID=UPI00021AD1E1|nr:phosphoserine phosphatase [Avibacterium paragallinarum]AZI15022.1 phosphoserine phosphatase [Avibacterium paragallinarum]QIR12456.1 phosphoserine phosphatase [Avibacterium paragallinarum]QJE10589.1 phosphoserine phosphatase [Avibacterium paragallinarum]QJE12783.1 phosphoserine phosphatase [Avibacterium paragallinarum]QJE14984.1 phosphoserine phosphatase [Avibacterium paragallinarum]